MKTLNIVLKKDILESVLSGDKKDIDLEIKKFWQTILYQGDIKKSFDRIKIMNSIKEPFQKYYFKWNGFDARRIEGEYRFVIRLGDRIK